jgi:transposase
MRATTLLNHLIKFKGYVIEGVGLDRESDRLDVRIRERSGTRVSCPKCGKRCTVHDHQPPRRYESIPMCHVSVMLVYAPRRADCPKCGVHTEHVPWASGKSPITKAYAWFLAGWAKRLPWAQVATIFGVGWGQVYDAVRLAVEWGKAHRDISMVEALGIDEVYFGIKNGFRTLLYDLGGAKVRLLAVAEGHKEAAAAGIFESFGPQWCAKIRHVCSDMWRAYLKAAYKWLPNATHILDRFHIEKLLNKAVDQVRRAEASELADKCLKVLKNMRYVCLKRPENLTDKQRDALQNIINKRRMKTVRAYNWKESFRPFWQYERPFHARKFLKRWTQGGPAQQARPGHALCPHDAGERGTDPELVQGQETLFQRRRGGHESGCGTCIQFGEGLSKPRNHGNRLISRTWRPADRPRVHPQILVMCLNFLGAVVRRLASFAKSCARSLARSERSP